MERIDRWFGISARGSSVATEGIGGATTFVTMAYILLVNPSILAGTGLPAPAVLASTALVAGVATLGMGLFARYPFAMASGMGLNAVVAFDLVGSRGLSPAEAMGVVVAEGLLVALLVAVGVREAVLDAVPMDLKRAIAGGIGLFLAMLGLVNGGIVRAGGPAGPVAVRADLGEAEVAVFVVGLVLGAALVARRVPGALLIGIAGATVAAWGLGVAGVPAEVVASPDLSLVGRFSFGFVAKLGALSAALAVFTLLLADFFDTMGSAVALGEAGGFLRDGRLPRMNRVLLVDALGAVAGGAASCSSATTYVESASGIAAGARTGLASVVTGILFLLAIPLGPLAAVVPAAATAPALVIVGFLMIAVVREIAWDDPVRGLPALLTLVGMPLTGSITDGIGAGFLTFTVLSLATGRAGEVRPPLAIAALLFAVYFAL